MQVDLCVLVNIAADILTGCSGTVTHTGFELSSRGNHFGGKLQEMGVALYMKP